MEGDVASACDGSDVLLLPIIPICGAPNAKIMRGANLTLWRHL